MSLRSIGLDRENRLMHFMFDSLRAKNYDRAEKLAKQLGRKYPKNGTADKLIFVLAMSRPRPSTLEWLRSGWSRLTNRCS